MEVRNYVNEAADRKRMEGARETSPPGGVCHLHFPGTVGMPGAMMAVAGGSLGGPLPQLAQGLCGRWWDKTLRSLETGHTYKHRGGDGGGGWAVLRGHGIVPWLPPWTLSQFGGDWGCRDGLGVSDGTMGGLAGGCLPLAAGAALGSGGCPLPLDLLGAGPPIVKYNVHLPWSLWVPTAAVRLGWGLSAIQAKEQMLLCLAGNLLLYCGLQALYRSCHTYKCTHPRDKLALTHTPTTQGNVGDCGSDGKENRFTQLVETASLQGLLWDTAYFCRPQRESQATLQRDISALCPPYSVLWKEGGLLERGCSYTGSGILFSGCA
ncbi:hypothetical protein CRENBAI_022865 [Crenichthys baileyi]|uniref:Uncharacterized protein n=1 Tax=Crenichthys baileyi TaxID=28760 RepID=A0AAV9RI65_9TELE